MDLLDHVCPQEGWYALLCVKNKQKVVQTLVETKAQLYEEAKSYCDSGWDTYFGLASFISENGGRVKSNVKALKSFWLDIDCGEAKAKVNEKTGRPFGYPTQKEGLYALQEFCSAMSLPSPTLVNSGNGIHAYWALSEEVTREDWEPVAAKLRSHCEKHKLHVDHAVFEVSRVLRLPNTFNYNTDKDKKPVEVRLLSPSVDFKEFTALLGVEKSAVDSPISITKRGMTKLGKAIQENIDSSFSKIMTRSLKGEGCSQLADCYMNRETLSEPRWFDALSIAKFCNDRDKAIHQISKGHPDYSYDNTERKILHILGPHSCAEIEKNNPGGCDNCPHKGKITNPLALGKVVPQQKEVEITIKTDSGTEVTSKNYVIPKYPFPYGRGKNGGVYYLGQEDEDPKLVYENDIYVVKRMTDLTLGDCALIRLHLPMDGVREFVLSNVQLSDKTELRKKLAMRGVVCPEKRFAELAACLNLSVKELQYMKKAESMRPQFGWVDRDTAFILGDREITKDGVYHSPPADGNESYAEAMKPAGTFEKWKEVFNLYGKKGLEPHAFAALSAFGSVLFKFTGHSGALINLMSGDSGTGKTTILRMANSVFGHPDVLCSIAKDTMASKFHKMGVFNNLLGTFDELTNLEGGNFSDLAYGVSQGRGWDRMEASSNKLRVNTTTWQSIGLATSNSAFYQKLQALKSKPAGEMMRLFEYRIEEVDVIDKEFAKEMFNKQLTENYGHAMERFLKWVVPNLEEAKRAIANIQRKIDAEIGIKQSERFWTSIVACNLAGGLIAKELGLLDWDLMSIYRWSANKVLELRKETAPPDFDTFSIITDYVLRNENKVLVVNDGVDLRTKKPSLPIVEPKGGELRIRIEPDTKLLWLHAGAFKADCVALQIDYLDTLKKLKAKGVHTQAIGKRLSKGMATDIGIGVVHSLCFNISGTALDNPELLAPNKGDTASADRGD